MTFDFDPSKEPLRALSNLIIACEDNFVEESDLALLDRARVGFDALRTLFGDNRPAEDIAYAKLIEPTCLHAASSDLLTEAEQSAKSFEAAAHALIALGGEQLAQLGFTDMAHDCIARAKASRTAIAKATGAAS